MTLSLAFDVFTIGEASRRKASMGKGYTGIVVHYDDAMLRQKRSYGSVRFHPEDRPLPECSPLCDRRLY